MDETKKTLSVDEFKKQLGEGECMLIDVRTQEEHTAKSIEGTHQVIDIRQPDFDSKVSQLDKNKKYLVYCGSGMRSAQAVKKMTEMGFKEVHDLEGGMSSWK